MECNQTTPQITFDNSVKEDILDVFEKDVNNQGAIIEKDNPDQEVLSFDGQEISIDEFGGIKKGSEVFIKNDLISLMRLSEEQKWVFEIF